MLSKLPTLGAIALATTSATYVMADEDKTAWRVFIADQDNGRVTALNLASPDQRWQFDLAGPSRLYASPTGAAVVAVQSDHDRVDFLSSGITLETHGDHADIEVSDPVRLDASLEGPRPFHVVTHDGTTSINFDLGGYVAMMSDADILDGGSIERFEQARAHHGFAVPMGGYVVSSVASDAPVEGGGAAPRVGIQAFDGAGEAAGDMQVCTDLHGEAFSGAYLLAGCNEGVVALTLDEGSPSFSMLAYPEDLGDGKTGTLLGAQSMQVFLGNYGAQSVVVIDPTEAPYFTKVDLPFRRVDFVLDPAQPQFAYILTEDGALHRLNMLTASIEQSETVTEPYSMDGHWRDPRPRLAVAGDALLLTDPREGLLRVVDPETLAEEQEITVNGLPYNLVAVGGSGLTH